MIDDTDFQHSIVFLNCCVFVDPTVFSRFLGQAFDTANHELEITSTCTIQNEGDTVVQWKYNSDNSLPNCIRK